MITALPVPSVKVFHKTYYQEKGSRIGNSQPGSPLAESEAVLAMIDKEQPEYYFCGKVKIFFFWTMVTHTHTRFVFLYSLLIAAVLLFRTRNMCTSTFEYTRVKKEGMRNRASLLFPRV